MSLQSFFQWCDSTAIGVAIRNSTVLFPIIEAFHLFGLTLLLGTVIILSLRLFGFALRRQSVSHLARALAPLTWGSIAVMLTTGLLLFLSEANKCYGSPPFRVKMIFLFLAILFQATALRSFTKSDRVGGAPVQSRLMASVLLFLWFGVGLAGRVIGFF